MCVISHWLPAECRGSLRLPPALLTGCPAVECFMFSQKHSVKLLRVGWSLLLPSGNAKKEVGKMETTQCWFVPTSHLSRCFYLALGKQISKSSQCALTLSQHRLSRCSWKEQPLGRMAQTCLVHNLDVKTQRSDFLDWFKLPHTVTVDTVPGVSASYFPLQCKGN